MSCDLRFHTLLTSSVLLLSISSRLFGFYVGGSISCLFVMPSIYWSNIVKNQWMAHNKARAEVAMGEWTSTLLSGSPEFTFQQNKLESISPEELLLEKKYKTSIGGAFYVGVSKLSANRFCYGFEVKAVLKGISVNRKESNKELLNADDTFLVYQKHQLLGKVTYSMNVEYYKNLELSACVRLGYFSTNRIMPYIKFGGSANRNEYRELRIDTASDLSVQRFDDSVYAEYLSTTYLKDIKPSNYTVPKKKQWYAAINVGPGVDYFVSRKFFTRFEYEFKMAFSSRSSTLSNVNADEDIYKAYGLRYQDIEHCISIGFGVYL